MSASVTEKLCACKNFINVTNSSAKIRTLKLVLWRQRPSTHFRLLECHAIWLENTQLSVLHWLRSWLGYAYLFWHLGGSCKAAFISTKKIEEQPPTLPTFFLTCAETCLVLIVVELNTSYMPCALIFFNHLHSSSLIYTLQSNAGHVGRYFPLWV